MQAGQIWQNPGEAVEHLEKSGDHAKRSIMSFSIGLAVVIVGDDDDILQTPESAAHFVQEGTAAYLSSHVGRTRHGKGLGKGKGGRYPICKSNMSSAISTTEQTCSCGKKQNIYQAYGLSLSLYLCVF